MRDFNFQSDNNTSAADIAPAGIVDARPQFDEIPLSANADEVIAVEAVVEDLPGDGSQSMRPFQTSIDDDEDGQSNSLPKLVAAAVVGLLVVGGGIYAYESSSANRLPSVKAVAMKTTAPVHQATNIPAPENATPSSPAPVTKTASVAPAQPVQSVPVKAPVQQASATPGVGIGPTDDAAINAPMTFTADNAPAPQGGSSSDVASAAPAAPASDTASAAPASSAAPNQTALQQPITPPNVPGSAAQPESSVATNSDAPRGTMLRPNLTPSTDTPAAPQ